MIGTTAKTVTATLALTAALAAMTVQSATAKSGDGVRVAGTCSDVSSSKLKVKRDGGRLQVEFEVDQNRNRVPWAIELRKDGRLVFQGVRQTLAPSGSFSLERHIAGTTGIIKARATRSGEVCSATISASKVAAAVTGTATAAATTADDRGRHAGADDSGNHTGSDDSGHHGSDD